MKWSQLVVTDTEGEQGTLGDLVTNSPELLRHAIISGGRIVEWQDHFLSAPGEDPDWDTPRCEVEWAGFEERSD